MSKRFYLGGQIIFIEASKIMNKSNNYIIIFFLCTIAVINESDSTSYDSDDDDVAARQTQPISSAQPISSTQPTSSRQQTSTQSVCSTCGTQMKKKLHAYCPNCSKQKNEAKRLKKN